MAGNTDLSEANANANPAWAVLGNPAVILDKYPIFSGQLYQRKPRKRHGRQVCPVGQALDPAPFLFHCATPFSEHMSEVGFFAPAGIDSFEVMVMAQGRKGAMGIGACIGMLVLILDARTGIAGAREGITVCVQTVIPTLFPFFVLGAILTDSLGQWKITRPLTGLCRIPRGSESILRAGLTGGYPVGAQCIGRAHAGGELTDTDAQRMLGFCSNAGPGFLLGMGGIVLGSAKAALALWGIHVAGAIAAGIMLPGGSSGSVRLSGRQSVPISRIIRQCVSGMGSVCAWVMLFRMLLAFLERWILWALPADLACLTAGFLELTNGFLALTRIPIPGYRFVLAAGLSAFGGVCVIMQTRSVADRVSMGFYIPGKILQASVSMLLALPIQYALFPAEQCCRHPVGVLSAAIGLQAGALVWLYCRKKRVAFRKEMVYNGTRKKSFRRPRHAV